MRRLVPRHWNKQVFTWADFEFFCGLDGVSVYEQPLQERPAFYCVFAGSPSIFIDHKVKKSRRLWVLFHELAHHWLHTPEIHWFDGFDQRAYVSLQRTATPRLSWFLSNEFAQLPTTDLVELYGVPFMRLGVTTNRLGAGLKARLTKLTDLGVRYDNEWSSFDHDEDEEFVNGGTIHTVAADLRRRLTERVTVGAEGRLHRSDVTRLEPRVTWFQEAGGLVSYQLSKALSADAAAGISHVVDSRFDETRTSPYYRVGLQHATARATIGVHLEQSYTPSYGLSGSNDNRELDGFVHMPFSRNRFYVEADGSWRRSNPFFDVEVRNDTIVSHTRIGYSTRRWLRIEGYYAFSRQDSIIPGAPIQRHRIGMQLVVSQPMRIQ